MFSFSKKNIRLRALAIEVAEAWFTRSTPIINSGRGITAEFFVSTATEVITRYGEEFSERDIRHIAEVLAPKELDKIHRRIKRDSAHVGRMADRMEAANTRARP